MSVWNFQSPPGYLLHVFVWSQDAEVDLYRRGYRCEVVEAVVEQGRVLWQSGSPWLLAAVGKTLDVGERSPDCFCGSRYSQLLDLVSFFPVSLVSGRSPKRSSPSSPTSRLLLEVYLAVYLDMSWFLATVTHRCRARALIL